MAAFAILFSTSLWFLVLSQDSKGCVSDQCGLKGSKDETSMVQVDVGQSRVKSDLLLATAPVLAAPGQNCQEKCGGAVGGPDACDVVGTATISIEDLNALVQSVFGQPCAGYDTLNEGAPFVEDMTNTGGFTVAHVQCVLPEPQHPPATCSSTSPDFWILGPTQRACRCLPISADSTGDPHMHSFRGAHYTLLKQGVFVAWNYSKPAPAPSAPPAEWQLLAAYAGEQFTTQGLLLLDPHAGSMEITAEDCLWRIKEENSPWRKADLEEISEDGRSSIQVKKLHEKLGETKIFRSSIVLQMGSGSQGTKSIASLVAHCIQQNHLDFKLTMFDRKDLDYVGGELGMAPDGSHNYHMFSKKSMVQMRADQEFQAPGSWVTLGGSPAGAAYLEKKQQVGASFTQLQTCSDAEEEAARAVCSKHLDEQAHPDVFSDCLFDLCRGGDESFAQSAAAFLLPLEGSA